MKPGATWFAAGSSECQASSAACRKGRSTRSSTFRSTSAAALGGQKITDSVSFCNAVLETAHVSLVPGVAFGAEGYARLSYATSREILQQGLDRLERFLAG